jgi:hypothetical protein
MNVSLSLSSLSLSLSLPLFYFSAAQFPIKVQPQSSRNLLEERRRRRKALLEEGGGGGGGFHQIDTAQIRISINNTPARKKTQVDLPKR